MRLIKYTHACVRLEDGDRILVIDPGTWSEPAAIEGATDILVTHEHADHIDADRLREATAANPALIVHTHPALAGQLQGLNVHAVDVGEEFTASGFTVRVVGGAHAEIYDGLPGCPNVGFIVDGNVYHPGDSFFVPAEKVETLLVPASAPWFKLGEALDFVRGVAPVRALQIHDALLNERGLGNFAGWMNAKGNTDYTQVLPGESVTL